MSVLRPIALVAGVAWICGACAHSQAPLEVADAVGPAPPVTAAPAAGLLRVYTPTEEHYDEQALYFLHRDYGILTRDGDVLRHVRNAEHPWDETPALVPLPAGSYAIRSWILGRRVATIPVVVETGRTTNVWLDGSFAADRADAHRALPPVAAGPGRVVRLPDGEIIGWSAGNPPRR